MKKIKWHLLLLAAFGICAGYVNKPPKVVHQSMDTYQFAYSAPGKYYYGDDLTSVGARAGIDYDCVMAATICTFIANPASEHEDGGGTFFYTTDVPNSGIINNAVFEWF
ncbi:MAG TPA: hypothetical protein VG605_15420 [Puia sp.]|nr:hypothetical protein [Puia sp.]